MTNYNFIPRPDLSTCTGCCIFDDFTGYRENGNR